MSKLWLGISVLIAAGFAFLDGLIIRASDKPRDQKVEEIARALERVQDKFIAFAEATSTPIDDVLANILAGQLDEIAEWIVGEQPS